MNISDKEKKVNHVVVRMSDDLQPVVVRQEVGADPSGVVIRGPAEPLLPGDGLQRDSRHACRVTGVKIFTLILRAEKVYQHWHLQSV